MEREKTQTKKQQRPRPNLRGVLSFQPKMCYFQYPEAICPSSRSFPETEGKPPEKKRKKVKQKNRRKKMRGRGGFNRAADDGGFGSLPLPRFQQDLQVVDASVTATSALPFFLAWLFVVCFFWVACDWLRHTSVPTRPLSAPIRLFFFCFFPCLFIRNKKGGRHADSRRR